MVEQSYKDVFISYKDDDQGKEFAGRLADKLKLLGYEVYYNYYDRRSGNFPEELRQAVLNCKDLLLVVTNSCLEQLIRNEKVDWIREELVTAHENGKRIIPLLLPHVAMPKDKDDMPEKLRFFPDLNSIPMIFEPYDKSPMDILFEWMDSKPEREDEHKFTFNSSEEYDVNQDFAETLALAESGDPKAMFEIGIMYYFGFSSPDGNDSVANYREAAKWFRRLSESENEYSDHANTMIAKMYFSGVIPRGGQSFEKCLEYYEKATDGDSYAKSKYELMSLQGLGCMFDYSRFDKIFDAICSGTNGMDTRLLCDIAAVYVAYGQFEKASQIYERASTRSGEAEYQKGLLHKRGLYNLATGEIPVPNYREAEICFRNASDKNHLQATYELANIYFNPINKVVPDFEKACYYFEKAANKGHTESQYKLGWIFEYGLVDGKKDYSKAIEYYEKAAANGHALASLQLAQLYQQPGVCNYQKAFEHAKKSADTNCDIAMFILANMYFFGRGTECNIDLAYDWYKKAFSNGIYYAKFMLEKIDNMD